VDERLPEQSQQATLRSLGDDGLRTIVDEYVAAWESGDVDAVVAMLAEDAAMTMPPIPTWYAGREAIAAFLGRRPLRGGLHWRLIPARANGQLAFGKYLASADNGTLIPHGLNVLTLNGARIAEITAFLTPEAFGRFGLPGHIQS
jgi:RNA polymerase sigma-70 factor (ECF subfamily)